MQNVISPEPYLLRLSSLSSKKELAFMTIVLVLLTNHVDAFLNPKNASETNVTKHPGNLKNVRDVAPPVLNIDLRRQCQPLTFRPMPASNGPQSTSDET